MSRKRAMALSERSESKGGEYMQKHTGIILAIVLIIVAAAGGFFGGMKYQQMQRGRLAQFAGSGNGNGQFQRRFGNGQNGGIATGEVLSEDDKSLTVKLPDGSSKIIVLSSSTVINKQATGSLSDIKTGDRVAIFGSTNSDGSLTAQSIQLNPPMRMGTPRPTGTQ